jgi:AcrR family transcriptional regulator
MTPRPRKASDEQVIAATVRVMARRGPSELTLAEIAREAGLTAGALVQRFGSKRGLLLAIAAVGAEGTQKMFDDMRAAHASPLAALRYYAESFGEMGESPGTLAHHLGYLQMDLTDPEFHPFTLAQARAARAGLRALLEDAVAAGELKKSADADALARAVQVMIGGSLITWGFYREGPAAAWVRQDLDVLLAPYVRKKARRS